MMDDGAVMSDTGVPEPPEPIIAQMRLQSAFLLRCLSDGSEQQFILEEVASRKRERFDGLEAMLARLQELLAVG
jgi:hypothetical protein